MIQQPKIICHFIFALSDVDTVNVQYFSQDIVGDPFYQQIDTDGIAHNCIYII